MRYLRANKYARDRKTFFDTIEGELLTKNERKTLCPNISDSCFDTVEVKKGETYSSFGTRYPMENAMVIVVKEGGVI